MQSPTIVCDAFIMDTYRCAQKFFAGAITYRRRKKIQALRWKQEFETQEEANSFVRDHFRKLAIPEAENEGVLRKA